MTIQESTICSLIQSFPVLIIIAHNTNRCLKTPFVYKPPTPTQPPEYYHALDALFQSIYGHQDSGHSYHPGYSDHGGGHYGSYGGVGNNYYGQTNPCSYGMYGKKYYDNSKTCYQYFYPSGSHYQSSVYNSYPNFGYKKANLYDVASNQSYAYVNYAADQVYNGNTKYKVVVKRTRIGGNGGKKKSEKLKGFFPRSDRASPFDITHSFLPKPNRLRDTFNGLFNIIPTRSMPAIIHDQSPGRGDQIYYQTNFDTPVVFPTNNPQERPDDGRPNYNPYTSEQPYQNNQPNEGIPNQVYTEGIVSFPVEDNQPNPGSNYGNSSPNYEINQGGQNYGGNGQSQNDRGQENTSEGSAVPNDSIYTTTKLPNLEEQTEGQKYENRFGSNADGAANLPTLPDAPPPNFEPRSVNFGPSGLFTETCQTVENEIGSCINLKQCEPYIKLVREFKSNPGAVQLLRSAHCGFEGNDPKVCCPRPGLPTAQPRTTTTTTTTSTTTTTTTIAPIAEPSGKSIGPEDFVPAFPEPPVCGVSNASFSRVVGGVDAKLGDFPWMALLGYKKRNNPTQWLCGGSLITSKHVMTASHCIYSKENELYIVRLGELDLVREDDGAAPVDVFIKHMIKHEQYNPKAYTNDIAILVLQENVQFSDLIRPICLPQTTELRSMTYEDYNPMVAGWGNLEARGPAATHLQVVQLPVVSNDFCKQSYRNYTNQKIDERVLCAGFKKGGKDSCRGDSGGPLMQPIWNNKDFKTYFFQIGVVSFGKGCAEAGFPGVYSRVTHFMPWLQEKVTGHA